MAITIVQAVRTRGRRESPVRMLARLGQIPYLSTENMAPAAGFYACRFVDERSIAAVTYLALMCGITAKPKVDDPYHVTLAFSKTLPQQSVLTVDTKSIDVKAVAWDTWKGHNGKGYVVLRVEADALTERNAAMMKAGCTSNFPEYKPHITVATGEVLSEKLLRTANTRLRSSPPTYITLGTELFHPLED